MKINKKQTIMVCKTLLDSLVAIQALMLNDNFTSNQQINLIDDCIENVEEIIKNYNYKRK